ncbi:MAG: hypothetical protein CVU90_08115 [Firmicutes bacterium HGW-Firmicutes-15]|nr:MAG: hypothetical protein CVU90_08115 [Firmicutes bacterium HGW-Firmicutes-15]
MHVAMDLGNKYTYLACWEKGRPLSDACISVRIPGVAWFSYTTSKSFRDRDGMREYLDHLYREYILPSRIMVESAAVSLPYIFNLNTHRMLLDVLEEVLGLPEVSIMPQPLALVHGYNLQNPQLPLTGDIMVIQTNESELHFAFLSIMDTAGLTLEKQFTGSLSQAQKEAELIGFYSPEGWKLDSVLLGEEPPYPQCLDELIRSLPKEVNIISEQNLQFTTVDGLSWGYLVNSPNLSYHMNFIYPYEFYIKKMNPNQESFELVKIPFDTDNLELECGASYQLLTLDSSGIYNLVTDQNRVKFHIYELDTRNGSCQHEQTARQNLILEIDSLKSDLPDRMHLYLDMAAASLGLDLWPGKPDRASSAPMDFNSRLLGGQGKLYEMMKSNECQQRLLDDFENHLIASNRQSQEPLITQIELTLFRLYALLQLWKGK